MLKGKKVPSEAGYTTPLI